MDHFITFEQKILLNTITKNQQGVSHIYLQTVTGESPYRQAVFHFPIESTRFEPHNGLILH